MSRYIVIAIVRIEHNYYNPPENRFINLEPTLETQRLMRQRQVIFKRSSECEWQWISPDDAPGFMEEDVLEVSMTVKDPYFLEQIEKNGYDFWNFYKFKVENRIVEVNADYTWRKETNGQKQGSEFFRIVLKPIEILPERLRVLHTKMEQLGKEDIRETIKEQLESIKHEIRQLQEIGRPKFTIRFSSPAYYWEYLYIFRDENDMRGKDLVLKSPRNIVKFSPPERYERAGMGSNVWRIVSTERISLKKEYDIPLQLFIGTRIESRFVSPPQMGKFQSESPYTIREICYIREQ